MRKGVCNITMPLLLVFVLLACGSVTRAESTNNNQKAGARFLLRIKGTLGERYKTEITSKSEGVTLNAPEGVTIPPHSEQIRMVVETQVEEIKSDGCIVISQRIKQESDLVKHGANTWEFDSTDPGSRKKAENSPWFADKLKALMVTDRFTVEPTGDLQAVSSDGDTEDPSSQDALKSLIMDPRQVLPKQEVKVGDTWDMGSRSYTFPPIGRVTTTCTCVFSDIRQEGKDKTAVLQFTCNAKHEPDPESDMKYELENFKSEGAKWLSLTRGRFIFSSFKTDWTYKVTALNGEWARSHVTCEVQTKELEK